MYQCAALSYVLGNKVSYPLDVTYVDTVESYWSVQARSERPNCVVRPTTTKDVSDAVFVLSLLSKQTRFSKECRFAIRSGGHTPWAGSASQQGGVTIDLSGLDTIVVSPDQTVVGLGPGNRWADVYGKLGPLGLAVSGGESPWWAWVALSLEVAMLLSSDDPYSRFSN